VEHETFKHTHICDSAELNGLSACAPPHPALSPYRGEGSIPRRRFHFSFDARLRNASTVMS